MTSSHLWNAMTMNALMTHLWQSSVFAGLVWLFTIALRDYPARTRFLVWMAASIKFLLPFALLTALGGHWALPNSGPLMHGTLNTVIEEISQPFASSPARTQGPGLPVHTLPGGSWLSIAIGGIWLGGCMMMLIRWTRHWHIARRLVNDGADLDQGREVQALRRAEAKARIRRRIRVVTTPRAVEPGIFGVRRPVLMWPEGLSERLDDTHIAAIVAHEVEHVRRRDNLTAILHCIVEMVFWFHPAVWWVGSKMREERERACDERVLEHNAEPQAYADSILRVCAFCLESPLPCVAGVSGPDLRKRVLHILSRRSGVALNFGRRAMLTGVVVLALILPIGFGAVRGQSAISNSETPKPQPSHDILQFDVVSIKPTPSNVNKTLPLRLPPDGISFHGVPVSMVLRTAFGLEDDRILGVPSWANTKRYDIEAKVAPEDAPMLGKLNAEDRRDMLIPVLTQRFHLRYHHETRELPMYDLVVAKGGPKLTKVEQLPPPGLAGFPLDQDQPGRPANQHYNIMIRPGHVEANSAPVSVLVYPLSQFLGRTVVDKTGLTGSYNFTLQWTPDNAPPPQGGVGAPDSPALAEDATHAAPLFLVTAIQEQLGLKLESDKGSVDVIVIDHIDPPTPN